MPDNVKKYFFDHNVFDEAAPVEAEPEAPPPPTFSEAELESARRDAFAEGKNAGLAEAAASRETYVSKLLNTVVQSLPALAAAEKAREKTYEREAVALALEAFMALFPLLDQRHGLEETRAAIVSVLEDLEGKSEIAITVHPDALEGVAEHIDSIRGRLGGAQVEVRSEDSLGRGDCKVFWKDGGAVRDATALSAKIKSIMEERLAGEGGKVHNKEVKQDLPHAPGAAAPPPSTERGE